LQQLIEQSTHPATPNLKSDWNNFQDAEVNCPKLKLFMKKVDFNKFDRNFELSTDRDFEQDLLGRPEVGDCRFDPCILANNLRTFVEFHGFFLSADRHRVGSQKHADHYRNIIEIISKCIDS
jgi:hypothetical protein